MLENDELRASIEELKVCLESGFVGGLATPELVEGIYEIVSAIGAAEVE